MVVIQGTLEDDDLFRAQVACSEIVENWIGEECVGEECGEIISAEDVEKITKDDWLVSQDHEPFALQPRCYKCDKNHYCQLEAADGDCREHHPDQ